MGNFPALDWSCRLNLDILKEDTRRLGAGEWADTLFLSRVVPVTRQAVRLPGGSFRRCLIRDLEAW